MTPSDLAEKQRQIFDRLPQKLDFYNEDEKKRIISQIRDLPQVEEGLYHIQYEVGEADNLYNPLTVKGKFVGMVVGLSQYGRVRTVPSGNLSKDNQREVHVAYFIPGKVVFDDAGDVVTMRMDDAWKLRIIYSDRIAPDIADKVKSLQLGDLVSGEYEIDYNRFMRLTDISKIERLEEELSTQNQSRKAHKEG
jgi:hypothetical protein